METNKKERFAGESMLNEIVERGMRDPNSITELERDVVRARRTYLTDEQLVKLLGDAPVETTPVAPASDESDEEETEEVDLESMTVQQLKDLALEQEIDLGKAKTKEQIIAVLAENLE